MGYLHINNLYKDQTILLFKRCYALEKIHGTSAHITFQLDGTIRLFSGGESPTNFAKLFNLTELAEKFKLLGMPCDKVVTIYGEAYGGSQQGMSATYGKQLQFVAFDVEVGTCWLDVPNAHDVCSKLGLDFVHYVEISTELADIDKERDHHSIQAVRNGVTTVNPVKVQKPWGEEDSYELVNPKKREGVVLRPLKEMTLNNGSRVIAKHKRDEFKETATPREVDPNKMKVLADAEAIANEWVTPMRLQHVLDKMPGHSIEKMRDIIEAMKEDVLREATGEIVSSQAAKAAIGKRTAMLYKDLLKQQLAAVANEQAPAVSVA